MADTGIKGKCTKNYTENIKKIIRSSGLAYIPSGAVQIPSILYEEPIMVTEHYEKASKRTKNLKALISEQVSKILGVT